MKAKKTAPPRRRVSFAVDRDEIEINSDWVDAVMKPVATVAPREPEPAAVVRFPVPTESASDVLPFPAQQSERVAGVDSFAGLPEAAVPGPSESAHVPEGVPPNGAAIPERTHFFAPDEKNATGAESTTGERCTPVENPAAVDNLAPVAQIASVVDESTVAESRTVAELATVERQTTVENSVPAPNPVAYPASPVENIATVEKNVSGAINPTGEISTSTKDHRIPRPRPILRITDGLTPGQYAVYSLMYEAGEGSGDPGIAGSRIYKGGYADLGRLTGLSKRGIQNIVAELQQKQVIRIHQQPGYHRTETSAYLVPVPESVLRTWFHNGWRHALGKSKTLVP